MLGELDNARAAAAELLRLDPGYQTSKAATIWGRTPQPPRWRSTSACCRPPSWRAYPNECIAHDAMGPQAGAMEGWLLLGGALLALSGGLVFLVELSVLWKVLVTVASVGAVLSGLAGYWNTYHTVKKAASPNAASASRRVPPGTRPVPARCRRTTRRCPSWCCRLPTTPATPPRPMWPMR